MHRHLMGFLAFVDVDLKQLVLMSGQFGEETRGEAAILFAIVQFVKFNSQVDGSFTHKDIPAVDALKVAVNSTLLQAN